MSHWRVQLFLSPRIRPRRKAPMRCRGYRERVGAYDVFNAKKVWMGGGREIVWRSKVLW